MSIERSGVASSPKIMTGTESNSAKGKVKSGDDADTPEAGGFLALLTSLEPATDKIEAAVPPLTTDDQPQSAALPLSDPSVAPTLNVPNDLSMLLQQAGKAAGDKLDTFTDARPVAVTGAIRLAAPATGADKPEMLNSSSVSAIRLAAPATGADKPVVFNSSAVSPIHLATPAAGIDKPEVLSSSAVSFGAEKSGDVKQNADAVVDQMAQTAVPMPTHKARDAEGVAASVVDARALKLASFKDILSGEPALSGALVTSGIGDSFIRQLDRTVAKSSALPAGYGIEGLWGHSALRAGSRVDGPTVMADPSTQSLQTMVADTVSYWVTQGVQKAELKLDGFGGKPVEVTISLKGDEAHIGFRTDQPEIRQVLEGAVAHLKDLLTSEGLVLSGVFVGTSGQDGSGTQERGNRQGPRQAAVVTTQAVPTERLQRVNQSVGTSVDLFV